MKINWYSLISGKLQKQQTSFNWRKFDPRQLGETWIDIEEANSDELRQFLENLDLHPLQVVHCLDSNIDPGVLSFANSLLMEYPAAFDREAADPAYITILFKAIVLVTIRRGEMSALDDLLQSLTVANAPHLRHLPQLIYQILDQFADLNVDAQIQVRDQIQLMAKTLAVNPNAFNANDISQLRWQVGNMISLMENQLYCVSRLAAADIESLQEPHRKAYIQDLLSEADIAQRGAYRLESRVNDLYRDYQMIGSDRVEKRLRLLTIVSAITLPLGLVAGLLGMNVGGLPGTNVPVAFFKRKGWFD
jgi:Mg2+ and Co2+ transporter CorA